MRKIFLHIFFSLALAAPINAQYASRESRQAFPGWRVSVPAQRSGPERRQELRDMHLGRYFADFGLAGISVVGEYGNVAQNYVDQYVGPQLKIGSSWHLVRGNFRGFLRLTWLRAGIIAGDGVVICSAPLHLGLGHNFLVSENFSIDLLASGGLLVIGPGFLSDYVGLSYGLAPEIKFNIRNLVISAEYSLKRTDHNFSDGASTNGELAHFYALNLGFRF